MTKHEEIEAVFHEYFSNIFSTSQPTMDAIEVFLNDMDLRVTSQMNIEFQKSLL